ncbi:MAG: DUF4907 domain-containing protein [Chitinophagaceae bacterium]|nr:DUF4907 domain-containing protein [Chitinophagaceae bacterium]
MKKTLLLITVLLITSLSFINAQEPDNKLTDPSAGKKGNTTLSNKAAAAKAQLQYFIIKGTSGTYGYNVFVNGNLYINQPAIPGITGNKGFADTSSAGSVARLVIRKIRKGETPPAITIAELKKLNALK